MDNDTISFTYYKDQIRQYTRRIEKSYSSLDEYETDKLEFGKKATGYSLLEGVTYSVNTDDTELSIVISEKFDLGLFKETSITIPGDAEAITMKADYSLNDSISTVKSNLESTGYTCKNTSE